MTDETVREEIAFIRRAIEGGRGFAVVRGADLAVWGVAIAAAELGTYATIRGWWPVDPDWLWRICIVLPWVYSLRRVWRRLVPGASDGRVRSPMAHALGMVWLGCGIFLSTFAVAVSIEGEMREGWYNAVSAGVMGIGFFATSFLTNLVWLRVLAVAWWAAELLLYALRHDAVVLPVSAALMLLLLALPGLVLLRSRPEGCA